MLLKHSYDNNSLYYRKPKSKIDCNMVTIEHLIGIALLGNNLTSYKMFTSLWKCETWRKLSMFETGKSFHCVIVAFHWCRCVCVCVRWNNRKRDIEQFLGCTFISPKESLYSILSTYQGWLCRCRTDHALYLFMCSMSNTQWLKMLIMT